MTFLTEQISIFLHYKNNKICFYTHNYKVCSENLTKNNDLLHSEEYKWMKGCQHEENGYKLVWKAIINFK